MKKIVRFIVLMLAVIMMASSFVACSNNEDAGDWTGAALKNWGREILETNGGMVAETQNNVYFINGSGDAKGDNTLGVPVKGALVGISKADLALGKLDKAQVVVPKLFVSTSYKQGVFIYDGYVYYGTTNLDKNSDGEVAKDEMLFVKTKLDGTGTQTIYNVGSISTEFRISKGADNVVYITFYKNNAINLLNTKTGAVKEIIKTNEKVKGAGAESLEDYKFLSVSTGYVAVYTTTVYAEDYYQDKVEGDGIARATEGWNNLYAIGLDGVPVKKLDGSVKNQNYAMTFTDGNYVFYTQTPAVGDAITLGVRADLLGVAGADRKINTEITLDANVIIKDLEEAYWMDSSKKVIYAGGLTIEQKMDREIVAVNVGISGMISVEDISINQTTQKTAIIYDSENKIQAVVLGNPELNPYQISRDVATQTWYAPEMITVNGNVMLFYCDSSSIGSGYVAVTNLSKAKLQADEDDEETFSFVEDPDNDGTEVGFISVRLAKDYAKEVESYIDNASITLDKNDIPNFDKVDEAVAKFDGASKAVKEKVSQSSRTRLENLKYAKALAQKYYALKDYSDYEKDGFDKVAFKAKVDEATALRTQYKKLGSNQTRYQTIQSLVPKNLCFFYQEGAKLIAE